MTDGAAGIGLPQGNSCQGGGPKIPTFLGENYVNDVKIENVKVSCKSGKSARGDSTDKVLAQFCLDNNIGIKKISKGKLKLVKEPRKVSLTKK